MGAEGKFSVNKYSTPSKVENIKFRFIILRTIYEAYAIHFVLTFVLPNIHCHSTKYEYTA